MMWFWIILGLLVLLGIVAVVLEVGYRSSGGRSGGSSSGSDAGFFAAMFAGSGDWGGGGGDC